MPELLQRVSAHVGQALQLQADRAGKTVNKTLARHLARIWVQDAGSVSTMKPGGRLRPRRASRLLVEPMIVGEIEQVGAGNSGWAITSPVGAPLQRSTASS